MPPSTGPTAQRDVLHGLQERVRLGELVVVDEVREPRVDRRPEEAGGEPGDAREPTIAAALVANGRATKTRAAHEVGRDHQPRRERRSRSGPEQEPDDDRSGRKSATSSAATHLPECVRSQTSTVSAIDREPGPEARAERREEEQTEAGARRSSANCAAERRRSRCRRGQQALTAQDVGPDDGRDREPRQEALSSGVPTVTRIALGAPKPSSGRTITPSRSSASNSGARPLRRSRRRRSSPTAGPARSKPCARGSPRRAAAPRAFTRSPPLELAVVVEARERRDLRRRRQVERAPDLADRRDDAAGATP